MKGLIVFIVAAVVVAFLASRLVAWLRTLQTSPVPVGFGGRNP